MTMVTTAYFILGDMVLCIPILLRRGAAWAARAARAEAEDYGESKQVTWKLNH